MAESTFTVEKKLSESTTSTVYRARQEALDRTVLLKVLHKQLTTDRDFVARFTREARACAAIHSENIVQVYDLTEIDGAPAIVMQYVEGKSLKEILDREGKKDLEFSIHVATEVLKGLIVAHAAGIIHRDIKPGNILAGDFNSIMITDFGLASFPRSPTVTSDGMILGTPAYMSPEQARGEVLDARTDLFSLGVTLLEILTSRKIFEGDSYSDCLKRILSFSTSDIEQDIAGLPSEYSDFLCHLLAPRKEERYVSATEALQALNAGKEPIRFTRRKITRRALPALGIIFLCVLIISIIIFLGKRERNSGGSSDEALMTKGTATADTAGLLPPNIPAQKIPSNNQRRITGTPLSQQSDTVHANNDSGTVVINCKPWGMVYINGVYIGQTPLSHPVVVKAGNASVMFSNPSFIPITRNITVKRDSYTVVEENFLNFAGYLTIRVNPWAEIFIDDQYRGTTPLSKPLIASIGTRKIRLHNPVYEDLSYDASIKKGDTLILSFTFSERKHQ